MTVDEAREAKEELAAAIYRLIEEFDQKTGLQVESVSLHREDLRHRDYPFDPLVGVEVEVKLPRWYRRELA